MFAVADPAGVSNNCEMYLKRGDLIAIYGSLKAYANYTHFTIIRSTKGTR